MPRSLSEKPSAEADGVFTAFMAQRPFNARDVRSGAGAADRHERARHFLTASEVEPMLQALNTVGTEPAIICWH